MADVAYVPVAPSVPAHAIAITKSDDTVYDPPLSALFVGGAGDVTVVCAGQDAPVLFDDVVAGSVLNLMIKKVMSTGTGATKMTGMY